jgi:protein-arginine kinase activator protein McsA
MNFDDCGSPARFEVESCNGGGVYCEFCANASLGFNGVIQLKNALFRPRKPSLECPYCHSAAKEVLSTGMAGCPLCYEAFPEVWKKLGIGGPP